MSLLFTWDRFIKQGVLFLIIKVLVLKILGVFFFFFDSFSICYVQSYYRNVQVFSLMHMTWNTAVYIFFYNFQHLHSGAPVAVCIVLCYWKIQYSFSLQRFCAGLQQTTCVETEPSSLSSCPRQLRVFWQISRGCCEEQWQLAIQLVPPRCWEGNLLAFAPSSRMFGLLVADKQPQRVQ